MIEAIIFDFGDVFIDLNKQAIDTEFRKLGLTAWHDDLDALNKKYEIGKIDELEFMEGFQKGNAVLWSVKPCRKHGADHSCQGCYPVPRCHRRNSALSTLHHLSLQRKALRKTSNLF